MKYVIGLGRSGTSLVRYLLKHQLPFIAWDDTPTLQEKAKLMGCAVVSPDKAPWHAIHELILSPGIPTTYPEPHRAVQLARRYHIPFRGDIDYWSETLQHLGCKFIGITGTNGKSTTHAIIDFILKSSGIQCFSGGNSGVPVFDAPSLPHGSIINLEMSSYQLDITRSLCFDAGVILNITPDHLDRHGNLQNYSVSKQIQIERVIPGGLKVIGVDTPYSQTAYEALNAAGHTDIIPISASRVLQNGIYSQDNVVYSSKAGHRTLLGTLPDTLPGRHNAQNVMAALLVCRFLGVESHSFFQLLPQYPGLDHRQERVLDTQRALFINDSKATNADAALPALQTYLNIYWIVGGIAKEDGIRPLLPHLTNVDKIILIGNSTQRFQSELTPVADKVIAAHTLDRALNIVSEDLQTLPKKITVLLSPACASQDQFQDFEHRGRTFKTLVRERFGTM
jgi:UDP-N-acetylmuramoylalanine--D-glutamate ligase